MATIPNRRSQEIEEKFRFKNNTFSRAVKENLKDRIEIEVGDSKQGDFKPQVKIMRWDNEVNFSLRAEEHPQATVETQGKIIKYITPEYEVHQYELDPGDIGEDGGIEFEWVLSFKPKSNVLTATIESKSLIFYYQPPLTQEEIDNGAARPEHVVGSYAAYHKTVGVLNKEGGYDYKTGKAFHIYRPKVKDAEGNEVWADLHISDNPDNPILTVTIPKQFLKDAAYPVVVDPTFGFTSVGGSTQANAADITGSKFTTPSDFSAITSIVGRSAFVTVSSNIKGVVVDSSTLNILTNGVGTASPITDNPAKWVRSTYSSAPTMSASTEYILGMINSGNGNNFYDSGSSGQGIYDSSNNYTTPTNPTDATSQDRKYSIYAEYTSSTASTIVYDNSQDANTSGGAGSSITISSFTVGNNANRILVVGVSIEDNANGPDMPVTGITWNTSENFTKIRHDAFGSPDDSNRSELWYLLNPTATTASVVVSFTGAVEGATASVVSLYNVAQQAPEANNGGTTSSATGIDVSTTTTTNGSWLVEAIHGSGSTTTLYPASGQTERTTETSSGSCRGSLATHFIPTAGSTLSRWTSNGNGYCLSVAAFAPATEGNSRRILGTLSMLGVGN